jgi:hypothetical protein
LTLKRRPSYQKSKSSFFFNLDLVEVSSLSPSSEDSSETSAASAAATGSAGTSGSRAESKSLDGNGFQLKSILLKFENFLLFCKRFFVPPLNYI